MTAEEQDRGAAIAQRLESAAFNRIGALNDQIMKGADKNSFADKGRPAGDVVTRFGLDVERFTTYPARKTDHAQWEQAGKALWDFVRVHSR